MPFKAETFRVCGKCRILCLVLGFIRVTGFRAWGFGFGFGFYPDTLNPTSSAK